MLRFLFAALTLLWVPPAFATTTTCGTADDTPAIQAAVNAALASDGIVELPAGQCYVSSLDLTGAQGLIVRGKGRDRTWLNAIQNGAVVVDLTGALNVLLADFQLGKFNDTVVPAVGILTAQMAGNHQSNMIHFERLYVSGSYSVAAWYNLGVDSSSVYASQFYNYQNGIGTVVFTAYNWPGVQSAFKSIATDAYPPSDWSMFQVEMHNFSPTASASAGGWALWIGGGQELRWYGGNVSGQSPDGWASLNYAGGVPSKNIIFDGTTFYSDNGVPASCAVHGTGGVAGLSFRSNQNAASVLAC